VKKHFAPLDPDVDRSVEWWLENTHYSARRREDLRQKFRALETTDAGGYSPPEWALRVKSFIKDESYPTWKPPRGINSRTDEFKAVVGPLFKRIDHRIFANPWFIKTVPVVDRPAYILDRLGVVGPYAVSDYSAFESNFDPWWLNVEIDVFEYLTSALPEGPLFVDLLRRAFTGVNRIYFSDLYCEVVGRRMSGEMCTSSANGLSNYLIVKFLAHKNKCSVTGVVEGDDGLFKFNPKPGGRVLCTEDFVQLGFRIKLEMVPDLCEASFCGLVFDPRDCINVVDPVDTLVDFGWTTRRYVHASMSTKKALLRSRALSMAHQYAGCPVLQSFAHYVLRCTSGVNVGRIVKNMDWWERNQFDEVMKAGKIWKTVRPVGSATRYLVSRRYGLSIADQMRIESYFDGCNELLPIPYHLFGSHYLQEWQVCYELYTSMFCESRPGVLVPVGPVGVG
jgi:hypothetical protein